MFIYVLVAGMVVVRLAKFDCLDAAVLLHPGPITEEQINGDLKNSKATYIHIDYHHLFQPLIVVCCLIP